MLGRFIVLNTIGIGLLVAGWVGGLLPVLWAADKFYAFPILGCLLLFGLFLALSGRNSAALELADDLPVVGLGLTIIGLLWGANTVTDVDAFRTVLIDCTSGTLAGFTSYYWLKNVVRLCQ
jgi:hypothetical protein